MKETINSILDSLVTHKLIKPIQIARLKYLYKTHRWPDFEHPKDLNEKINWMKFYGDTSMWSILADKYAVRDYVKSKGLSDILIPLIGKWGSVDEVEWAELPEQFVMKCNNGSGDVIVCHDKEELDIESVRKHFSKMSREKLSTASGEPHYALIKPCIIAEKLLDSSSQPCGSSSLIDYKIYVLNGTPEYIWCTANRNGYHAEVSLYDTEWNFHPEYSIYTGHYIKPKNLVPKPKCLNKLLEIAATLSVGQPAVRIDLYVVNDKIYFGEITLTPQGGYIDFFTKDFLLRMGRMVDLSNCCR